ncbi:MAG: hypothetical protein GY749_48245, partial [Desulfobacteraceae bacterium]|nr:hypothetical protein [Desulfobacteraceae bacterium]
MYLAPLNYDRFFKKVFSDPEIARKFLEDFLDTEIESIEILKDRHSVTDDAAFVEFDFRCKIQDAYVIIDMQQWYKADVTQRFYLYHALNTGLQTEDLPKKRIVLDKTSKQIVKVKDYRALEPVYTLIWMVNDSLKFDSNYVSYGMTPENLLDIEDVSGKRIISTRLRPNLTIREENTIPALEVMARFAANPKWLIYLPPTMSPCETSDKEEYLEYPEQAFDFYRRQGLSKVVCQEKHMGSRAVVIVCRDTKTTKKHFGISDNEAGICYTRT